MSSSQHDNVIVADIEDQKPNQNQNNVQKSTLGLEDPACGPSNQYSSWREVDKAEAEARQERDQPEEEAEERTNAFETAHIIEDHLHQHKH